MENTRSNRFEDLADELIALAFTEDIGDGDHSSLATIPADLQGRVHLMLKEDGILSGLDVARRVYQHADPHIQFNQILHDGDKVRYGDIAFEAAGSALTLLRTERIVLNLMQRMSGIATRTAQYVSSVKGTGAKILDTRKTAPGLRVFDKLAVQHGGGHNHRMGLYDMIMLKDNHIDFAGGIAPALAAVRTYQQKHGLHLPVEVECRTMDDVQQVLTLGGVQQLMLDNFDIPTTRAAVQLINHAIPVESSGGITLANVRQYAECGVDFISIGDTTHHVHALDMNLKKMQ